MILFIDASVRFGSRTRKLAQAVLSRFTDEIETVRLEDMVFETTDASFLARRDSLVASGSIDDPMFAPARQFASADKIVIAAPYWDLSFPASLKQYIEIINVTGVTFEYTPEGFPRSLCRAKSLYYVTTAGGNFVPYEFGFGYIRSLAENFYGITDVKLISATGLDIYGADPDKIMRDAIDSLDI